MLGAHQQDDHHRRHRHYHNHRCHRHRRHRHHHCCHHHRWYDDHHQILHSWQIHTLENQTGYTGTLHKLEHDDHHRCHHHRRHHHFRHHHFRHHHRCHHWYDHRHQVTLPGHKLELLGLHLVSYGRNFTVD